MVIRKSRNDRTARLFHGESGITAIELMVAIVVLAVLAMLAGPSFQNTIERQRLKGAAEGLFGALQVAKSEAVKRNSTVRVIATAGTPWSYCVTTGTDCSGTPLQSVTGSDYSDIVLVSSKTVAFSPLQGTANSDSFIFRNPGDTARLEVRVSTLGRIRICAPSGKPVTGYEDC
jgi:type IV fimbrial biogenesis protein FimT